MQRGTWAAIGIVAMIGMPPAAAETVRGTAQIDGVDSAVELQTGEGIGELRYRPLAGAARWETVPLDTLAPVPANVMIGDALASATACEISALT